MLSKATANIGTTEKIDYKEDCSMIDLKNGFLEFKDIAIDKVGKTYYPKGNFKGFVVPHEETITIAKSLEVKDGEKIIYRPTVVFIYSPCSFAKRYLQSARINNKIDLDKIYPKDTDETLIVKGFKYPERAEIIYKEKIKKGTEYVGVLLLGSNLIQYGLEIE